MVSPQDQLEIVQESEVTIKVNCDDGIAASLSDYLRVKKPNSEHTYKFRMKKWNGYDHFFNKITGRTCIGLLPMIDKFSRTHDMGWKLPWNLIFEDEQIKMNDAKSFTDSLILTNKTGERIQPRDYQLESLTWLFNCKRTILESPTASGKSLVIYCLIRRLIAQKHFPILVIVPTIGLVNQLYSDFAEYSQCDNGWSMSQVQRIFGGESKDIGSNVVISTWQSIHEMPADWFRPFLAVIGDEAHTDKAERVGRILKCLTNARRRYGLTGTMPKDDHSKMLIEGLIGPTFTVRKSHQLIESGHLSNMKIECLTLQYSQADKRKMKGKEYHEEIEFLVQHPKRNLVLQRTIDGFCKGTTLLLVSHRSKQGDILYDAIRSQSSRPVFYIHGDIDADLREEVRQWTISNADQQPIIIATYGTFQMGINIPNMKYLILGSPSKSLVRVLQSIGRGLRTSDDKDMLIVFDVVDDLCYNDHANYAIKHFIERVNIYKTEKFPYRCYPISLGD